MLVLLLLFFAMMEFTSIRTYTWMWVPHHGNPRHYESGLITACESHIISIIYENTIISTNISIWLGNTCNLYFEQRDCIDECMHLYFGNSIIYIPQNLTINSNANCRPVTSPIDISQNSSLVQLKWRILLDPNVTVCDLLIHDLKTVLKNITVCEQDVAEKSYKFFVMIVMISSVLMFMIGFVIMFAVFAYQHKRDRGRECEYLLGSH